MSIIYETIPRTRRSKDAAKLEVHLLNPAHRCYCDLITVRHLDATAWFIAVAELRDRSGRIIEETPCYTIDRVEINPSWLQT